MEVTEKTITLEELKAMQLHEKKSIDLYNSVMRVPGGWIYTFTFASSENRDMEVFQNNVFVPEPNPNK